jgi:hypothetical protein
MADSVVLTLSSGIVTEELAAVGLPLPPALLSIVVSYCDSDGKSSCASFTSLLLAGLTHSDVPACSGHADWSARRWLP